MLAAQTQENYLHRKYADNLCNVKLLKGNKGEIFNEMYFS